MSIVKTKIRRFRFWWRLTSAYFNRYRLRLAILSASFILLIFLFAKVIPEISQKNVLNIGIVGSFTLETIPSEALNLATQPLISIDESGKPLPGLASHWTVSGDNKTYILFLKDNIKWHDGEEVDARQISIAITDVSITAINNKALKFELSNPLASFPTALNKPVFKAKSFYGTGAARIVAIDKTENIINKISLVPNDNDLPKVNLKFYPTVDLAINAFKIGDVKVVSVPNSRNFENWPNIETERQLDEGEIVTIFFDNTDNLLSSKELRQALIHAINRQNLDGTNAHSPISKKSWAFNESVKRYDYNPAKAKELLTKANIKKPRITLSFTPAFEKIVHLIKEDWQTIGVEVVLKKEKQKPEKFQAFLTTNKLLPDPDQYSLWHSSQVGSGNLTNYQDVKIDKLLEDGRSTNDETKRREYYLDFQKFLVEDAPAAFLYYPYKYRLVYKNVKHLVDKLPR